MGPSAAQLKWPALPLRPHCWWTSGLWEPSIGRQVLLPGDTCTLPWHPELVWHGCGAPSMGCWLALAAQAAKLPASATSPVLGTPQVWTSQALGLHCSVCQSSEPVFRALGA